MPSIQRNEVLGCAAPLGVAAVVLGAFALTWPEAPDRPRWEGAGHEERQSGGTFVFHHESNVRTLDPHIAYDELSGMAIRLMFDGLLDYDDEGRLTPSLAEAMPEVSDDGRTFRFRLRDGVRFHAMPGHPEGRELTAEDVRWSLERLLSQEVGSPGYPFFSALEGAVAFHEGRAREVTGIQVLDARTIEFTLEEADQTFLNAIAMTFAYPVPRENYEHWGEEVKFHPVGTGPFVFDEWERGVQLTFTRNRRYWRDLPGPDGMIFLENIQRKLAASRFRNGGIDAIHRQTPADYRFFRDNEHWQAHLEEYPRVSTFAVGFNTQMEPYDDVHLRRAIAFGLDRMSWRRARANRLQPAGQLLPPQIAGYDPELPSLQTFDVERAQRELAQARYRPGEDEPLTLMTGDTETDRYYGELFQEDMRRLGIEVRLRPVSFAVYLTETGKPNHVGMFNTGWNMDYPDPANFIDVLFHSRSIRPVNSQNRAFYSNPELDALLDRARGEPNRERRVGMYRQANELLAREAPWAFTYYPLVMELWQPYVRGYRPHPVWSEDYRSVWLDLPRQRVARMLRGPRATPARQAAALFPFGGL